jgi:membrane protein
MGSAIAFNSLFAIVPLGIAFVSVLTLLDTTAPVFSNLIEFLDATLPPEISAFIVGVLRESQDLVTGERLVIVVVSILVALWSGSRAIYAVQKSLRLVQGNVDSRGYVRSRLVGIGVTVAAMIAILVGYAALAIGENAWQQVADLFGIGSVGLTQLLVGAVVYLWVFAMLWAVYRFGPPAPIPYTEITAAVVTVVVVVGTGLISSFLPKFGSQAVAVFGSVGVILVWLYFIGVVVVALPIGSTAFAAAWDERGQR